MFLKQNYQFLPFVPRTPETNKTNEQSPTTSDEQTWKKYARIILPHIGLILLSLLYIVGGAFIFLQLEKPNEVDMRQESLALLEKQSQMMISQLWEVVTDDNLRKEEVETITEEHIDNISRLLFEAFDTHYIGISHLRNPGKTEECVWTMTSSLFFTTTLLTTIGYGNLVPSTSFGKVFCIFYALFGVPLILITVTDIGKFLSENIIWLYSTYSLSKKRHAHRHNSSLAFGLDDERHKMRVQLHELGLDNYVSIPITLIAAILLGYIMIGAVLLGMWENWKFFEGFYFSFITMTTVGFGDIVPAKTEFFIIDLFYIIVGLSITTMCIDLVGVEYIEKIHYFGWAISGARFALVNVGGKMVRMPYFCAHVLQPKYGEKNARLAYGAYAPEDLAYIRFIDYGSLASFESLTSILSSIFSRQSKPREPSAV